MMLTIATPVSSRTADIVWLEINTTVGNFVIQYGHAPMVLELAPGRPAVFSLKNGKQESVLVAKGIIEVTRTSATLLIHEMV